MKFIEQLTLGTYDFFPQMTNLHIEIFLEDFQKFLIWFSILLLFFRRKYFGEQSLHLEIRQTFLGKRQNWIYDFCKLSNGYLP